MDKEIKLIIACEVFKGELEHLKDEIDVDIWWIKHSLHDYPNKLNMELKDKINEAENILSPDSTILLMFGNCGGALDNLQSNTLNLIYPDVADCMPMLLGSIEKHRELQQARPGTFYFNKAWIDSGQGPLGSYKKYVERYGPEKAWKVSKKMYKHYTHFSLIDNGCYDLENYKGHVKEASEKFDKIYLVESGDLNFISDVLNGKCPMVNIPPHEQV